MRRKMIKISSEYYFIIKIIKSGNFSSYSQYQIQPYKEAQKKNSSVLVNKVKMQGNTER